MTDYAAGNKADYIKEFYQQYPDGIVPEFYIVSVTEEPLTYKAVYRGDDGFVEAQAKMKNCVAKIVRNGVLVTAWNQQGMERAKNQKFSRKK